MLLCARVFQFVHEKNKNAFLRAHVHRTPKGVPGSLRFAIYKHVTPPE
jgi:hypothetical protein